jgi:hypothetical protein
MPIPSPPAHRLLSRSHLFLLIGTIVFPSDPSSLSSLAISISYHSGVILTPSSPYFSCGYISFYYGALGLYSHHLYYFALPFPLWGCTSLFRGGASQFNIYTFILFLFLSPLFHLHFFAFPFVPLLFCLGVHLSGSFSWCIPVHFCLPPFSVVGVCWTVGPEVTLDRRHVTRIYSCTRHIAFLFTTFTLSTRVSSPCASPLTPVTFKWHLNTEMRSIVLYFCGNQDWNCSCQAGHHKTQMMSIWRS